MNQQSSAPIGTKNELLRFISIVQMAGLFTTFDVAIAQHPLPASPLIVSRPLSVGTNQEHDAGFGDWARGCCN